MRNEKSTFDLKKSVYIFLVMALLLSFSSLVYGVLIIMGLEVYAKPVAIIFLVVVGGYNLGQRWWDYVYVQKKYTSRWFDKSIGRKK